LYAIEDFWRNESNGLERNIRAESHALQTGEAIDFDRASSSSGRKGLADSMIDYVTDAPRDAGLYSDWLRSQVGLRVWVVQKIYLSGFNARVWKSFGTRVFLKTFRASLKRTESSLVTALI
jgi:hypothetical protein